METNMQRGELVKYLDELLEISRFSDYCPNGLQVEGCDEIKNVVTGVSASVDLFERSVEKQADAVIVHHGIIWDFERPVYKGGYKKRIKLLIGNDINLLAYHLPLDAHLTFGNAAQIAGKLKMVDVQGFGEYKGNTVGVVGRVTAKPYANVLNDVKKKINPNALIFPYGPEQVETIGIITGGAQKEVKEAIMVGLDMYITGEASEFVMHLAKEEGIHYIAAGHYATERFGIMALGQHLAEKFGLNVEFIDIPNPV